MLTKTTRKIAKIVIAATAGLAVFSVPLRDAPHQQVSTAVVYATGENTAADNTESKKEFAENLEIILKIIYLILRPFLALAGLALDNGMVYGSYFQLDSALFTFWNIIKNFANFALGFLFLRSILKYIFNFGNKATNPLGMISKLLIAGIGIQASRFVMGALIDVSTVATVGIGGLPLQMLKQEDVGDKPLFGLKTDMKVSDIGNSLTAEKGFVILYTYPTVQDQYYLPCAVKNQKMLRGDERGAVFGVTSTGKTVGSTKVKRPEQINQDYCMFGNDIMSKQQSQGKTIQPGSPELKTMLKTSQDEFRDDNNCDDPGNLCQTVANIANKGKGYQGAFYSLYGSLLNLGSIHVGVYKSEGSMTMEALIKAIIGIAYLVPLLILCVVLIIRIAILRVTIAFSPVLVLSEVFGFKLGDLQKFGVKNAISMIFLPVIATFAISISIVFLSVLSEGMTKGNSLDDIGMNTYAADNKSCISLIITDLCIDTPAQDIGVSGMLDFFPWLILNIFGIGLMRTILMAAMKSTAFTGGVVDSMDKFAKNMIMNAEIIPMQGGTSINALKAAGREINNSIEAASSQNARTVVNPTMENIIQKNFTGQTSKGKDALKAATGKVTNRDSAYNEVSSLVGTGGALYNAPNGPISMRGNQLDLSQYGNEGLDLINKIAATKTEAPLNNGKAYNNVESAFKDENFIRYLATPKDKGGIGLDADKIKSLYSGRDDLSNATTATIDKIAAEVGGTSGTATTGTQSGNTFTTTDGNSTYTMTAAGFTEKKRGSTSNDFHNDTKAWEALLPTMSKDTMKKMRDDGKVKVNDDFNKWLNGETTEKKDDKKDNTTTAAGDDTKTTTETTPKQENTNKQNTDKQSTQPKPNTGTASGGQSTSSTNQPK